MPATLIDGKRMAAEILGEVKSAADRLRAGKEIVPGLAFILVGDHPASESYVKMKGRTCTELGWYSVTSRLPETITQGELLQQIHRYNMDSRIHGILVQLPLPRHIDEAAVIDAVDYRKDVDGFHPVNAGRLLAGAPCFRPCTPLGVQEMLLRSGNDPSGRHVVIVGRSNIVGKPLANMLFQKQPGANAVVTIAHTGAADLRRYTRDADILIAAIGRPGFLTGEMMKPGAVVIDVGINRVPDAASKGGYRIAGDVDFPSAAEVASAISPVPGGVGPMTIAMLMSNTLAAASGRIYPVH
ncbi:MAG TPA: bifunctional 5,10-methylenetetrahydrofolate dehydrogenase/5,10-methenyltetrahydrofolate cyclohydrolase [Bacteroidota bacterium]|nr:bifunctional 5,10-methylenetetrahydrofolate dehydrogenase/5,10-methenyltetrahydrofolate cyclohydrolase [Bacteroidota bacterium]